MAETLSVPRRFNGPLESGHGGYCSAVIADYVEGPAEVTLRSPVPLDATLGIRREDDGSVRVLDGDTLIADAVPTRGLDVEVPRPVSPEEARAAKERYRGSTEGLFSHCFVCGPARQDALGVFAGTVNGRELVASTWTPPEWTADEAGRVLPAFVWAVMDCPTYFAVYREGELPMSFLGRMAARIDAPVAAGEEHVVTAWPISAHGRKRLAGAAVVSGDGEVLAVARALMIEPREDRRA
ncbi:MAG TPA: hypothetical protein VLB79_11270 [Solirubrobacterales bacterium]|nr:hypothetical protein [Solirubrobacterales bacterium]